VLGIDHEYFFGQALSRHDLAARRTSDQSFVDIAKQPQCKGVVQRVRFEGPQIGWRGQSETLFAQVRSRTFVVRCRYSARHGQPTGNELAVPDLLFLTTLRVARFDFDLAAFIWPPISPACLVCAGLS
jgi:hypothetical protein